MVAGDGRDQWSPMAAAGALGELERLGGDIEQAQPAGAVVVVGRQARRIAIETIRIVIRCFGLKFPALQSTHFSTIFSYGFKGFGVEQKPIHPAVKVTVWPRAVFVDQNGVKRRSGLLPVSASLARRVLQSRTNALLCMADLQPVIEGRGTISARDERRGIGVEVAVSPAAERIAILMELSRRPSLPLRINNLASILLDALGPRESNWEAAWEDVISQVEAKLLIELRSWKKRVAKLEEECPWIMNPSPVERGMGSRRASVN